MPLLGRSSRSFGKNTNSQVTDVFAKNTIMSVSGDTPKITYITDASGKDNILNTSGSVRPSGFNPYTERYYSNFSDGDGDYLTVPSASWSTLAGTFTVEYWIRWNIAPATAGTITGVYDAGGLTFYNDGTRITPNIYGSGNIFNSNFLTASVVPGKWYHLAITRDSSNLMTMWVDGVSMGSTTTTTTYTQGAWYIFSVNNTNLIQGNISNLRINNTCLYNTAFTPSTTPLTAVPGTQLLTCQSNRFIDNSTNAATITKNGGASINIAHPFAPSEIYKDAGSAAFNGGTDFITIPDNPNINLGSGDFTIEFWAYFNTVSAEMSIINKGWTSSAAYASYMIWMTNTGSLKFNSSTNGGSWDIANDITIGTMTAGNWTHIAVTRSGSTFRAFVNGVINNSFTFTNSGTLFKSSAQTLYISGRATNDTAINGNLSDVRILKGTCLYTGTFTPPTAPLKAIPNTALLTLQNNQGTTNTISHDGSKYKSRIVTTGEVSQTTMHPFGSNWSYYFSGTGDYVNTSLSSVYSTFYQNNFTIECWVYFNSVANTPHIFNIGESALTRGTVFLTNATLAFYTTVGGSGSNKITSATTLVVGQWYHVALTKSSGTFTLWLNGLSLGTSTTTSYPSGQPQSVGFGSLQFSPAASDQLNGYISNLRVVNGTAEYTSAFTPPSKPLTLTANTSLLTVNSSRTKDSGVNNLVLSKTANVVATKFSPFNNFYQTDINKDCYSYYFDGTGDYLQLSDNTAYDFTGDFTMEAWIYPTALVNDTSFLSQWTSGGWSFIFRVSSNLLTFVYWTGTASILTGSSGICTIPINTWTHVAVTRSGSTIRLFVNGVVDTNTATYASTISGSALMEVGGVDGNNNLWSGYISNVRVVKGTALYTTTFTPSTAPLTAVAGTSLLTCQSKGFVDNSTNNFGITRVGDVSISRLNPFNLTPSTITSANPISYSANLFGGSAYFDGSADYLTVAENSFQRLSNTFTIQGWFNATSQIAANIAILSKGTVSTGWEIGIGRANTLLFTNATTALATTSTIKFNEWNHFAVVRQSSANRTLVFLNGNLEVTGTITNPYSETSNIYIGSGRVAGANVFTGYIGGIQIDNIDLYSRNFDVPQSTTKSTINTVFSLDSKPVIIDDVQTQGLVTLGDTSIRNATPHALDGTYSYYFDGSGDYITNPVSPALQFGTESYTVDFWTKLQGAYDTAEYDWLESNPVANSYQIYQFTGLKTGTYGAAGINIMDNANIATLLANVWTHHAFVRSSTSSNDSRYYLNGNLYTTFTDTNDYSAPGFTIGGRNTGSNYFTGYISNMRAVKGAALYTGNFIPPTTPAKLTQTASTNVNSLSVPTNYPEGYASYFFNGTGGLITPARGDLFTIGTGDFTVEAWIYPTTYTAASMIMSAWGGTTGWQVYLTASGKIFWQLYSTDNNVIQNNAVVPLNQWSHISVSRTGGSIYTFINGLLATVVANSFNASGNSTVYVGTSATNEYFYGHISNLRFIKGTGLYSANNTPSTIPLTNIPGTGLITCSSTTFADRSNNKVGIAATGAGTRISLKQPFASVGPAVTLLTAQSRTFEDRGQLAPNISIVGQSAVKNDNPFFGATPTIGQSIYFDGTGDYIKTNRGDPQNIIPAGENFTVEAWVYPLTVTSSYLWTIGQEGSGRYVTAISNGSLYVNMYGSGVVNHGAIPANAWTHVAISRSSNVIAAYINGIRQPNTDTQTGTVGNGIGSGHANGTIKFGADGNGQGAAYTGYMKDIRITRGVARYTANIVTVPGKITPAKPYQISSGIASTPSSPFIASPVSSVEVLLVAGGGGAGGGIGGGAGGGGVIVMPSVSITPGVTYTITVGAGGTGGSYPAFGSSGSNTTVFGAQATGGGGSGGHDVSDGLAGGSGGGAASNNSRLNQGGAGQYLMTLGGNSGTMYGNRGGHMTTTRTGTPTVGAGGGGAGGQGIDTDPNYTGTPSPTSSSAGGAGIESSILGTPYYFAGGGGGGAHSSGKGGNGGIGGGGAAAGDGGNGTPGGSAINAGGAAGPGNSPGGAGGQYTGGGGGSAGWPNTLGGSGGSGIAVIRYPTAYSYATVPSSVVVSNVGGYQIYRFNQSGTIQFGTDVRPKVSSLSSVLVVAGGGGSGYNAGAGGGGGGLISATAVPVTPGTPYTINIGGGGAASAASDPSRGANGANTTAFGYLAVGGGGGGSGGAIGVSGGSGGGGPGPDSGSGSSAGGGYGYPSPTQQGYPGGLGQGPGAARAAGGGGGAGGVGGTGTPNNVGGTGGNGANSIISGTWVSYAGGGGGGTHAGVAGAKGAGGGGDAGTYPSPATGTAGLTNTGGGGGGGSGYGGAGAAGGSGVVIISYPDAYSTAATVSGATVSTNNGNTIYTFTSSGSITF